MAVQPPNRKLKLLTVSPDLFFTLLTALDGSRLVTVTGLPADATLIAATTNFVGDVVLKIHSETFPEVRPGEMYGDMPALDITQTPLADVPIIVDGSA